MEHFICLFIMAGWSVTDSHQDAWLTFPLILRIPKSTQHCVNRSGSISSVKITGVAQVSVYHTSLQEQVFNKTFLCAENTELDTKVWMELSVT